VRNNVLVAGAAALALAAAAAASAGASTRGVVASASGGYSFRGPLLGGSIDVHPFTWNVVVDADGSVHGRFNYTQVRDGVELTVRGSLTCAVIRDNHVWVGGVIEDSSRESLIGLDMWFQAQDNGEPGPDATPDMSSTVGAGPPGAGQQYCDDAPPVRFPFLLREGNLQVRPSA
jgi:opacity protein-like surface antigen